MTLRLNGSTSGYVEIAAPDVGANNTLTLPSGGELVAATAGNINVTSINSLNYPTAGALSNRNKIINGDMRIDQRNAGASVSITTAGNYTVDRWSGNATQNSKYTVQQDTSNPAGFTNSLKVTSSSSYSVTSSDVFWLAQAIEGLNASDLAWGTASAKSATLSFWVQSSLTGTFGGALRNSAANRSYPFTYTISSANTWEYKTVSIAGDTSGTWLTTNGVGINLNFGLGAGSTYSGTAGSWSGNNYVSATGATSVVATNGATFYITGVQLEAGTVATPFERRSYGQELALCQRYFESSYPLGYSPGFNFAEPYPFSTSRPVAINLIASDDTTVSQTIRFVVQKRAAPTVIIYSANTGATGNTWTYKGSGGTNLNWGANVTYTSQDLWNINQGLSAVNQANESYFHFTASAEL